MKNNVILFFLFSACAVGGLYEGGNPTQENGNKQGYGGLFAPHNDPQQTTITAGDKVIFLGLEDPNGLEFVEFHYLWYLQREKETAFSPRLVYRMSDTAPSVYFNTLPADVGQYLVLEVLYQDQDGFYNRYSVTSAEAIAAAPDIDESQGEVIFDRQWQFSKIPLLIRTDQTGHHYIWRVLGKNSQTPLVLTSGVGAGKALGLNAAYADDYGFQTTEPKIELQFVETGNYRITLEVFDSQGVSRNFISEQLNIEESWSRGGQA